MPPFFPKATLLTLLHLAREEELSWISTLSDSEKEALGTVERWSAKEVLAHISAWKERTSEHIQQAEHGDPPTSLNSAEQTDALNARIFAAAQRRTWETVAMQAENAFRELLMLVEYLPEEQLSDPVHFPSLQGEPLWPQILSTGVKHSYRHIAAFLLQQGKCDDALHLYDRMIGIMRRRDLPANELGRAIYQQAEIAMKAGADREAVTLLHEARRLQPEVATWVQQNHTFEPFRTDSALQAL
ncbi:uncharacterized protein DUF1706 [Thermosporothrix hazakensis]|jgi:tetratricopeptide (TPR) repeat protein|uniref:Uncharacterized protein DUF1706 n=1 Tax=Thermosporothrix hazakensis TaxID=644383 RepID=A0A326UC50_THEHA|nr:ClbS/DfsB family four-helix bundle protein [Thermosporothrix hazakensis]PZW31272.1 uncharacterized protein DUF1706 [Thermosporothrix hazakensis]GCE50814.1 hypothetical protein KTH_56830 [Thermosporothrix hazakensis]